MPPLAGRGAGSGAALDRAGGEPTSQRTGNQLPIRDSGAAGANARLRRGGLYDSVDAPPTATARAASASDSDSAAAAAAASGAPAHAARPAAGRHAATPPGPEPVGAGGAGGLSGPADPYERPTRGQLLGAQSRLRQDKTSGALDDVAGRYRELFGCHHLVHKGLRRSIGDAYAAYVGQVVHLPEDLYGLALGALDRAFNGRARPAGLLDLRLHTSPFATSRAKHAQIFNTAHKIMRDLNAYVYDVSYYCPGELDQLRELRDPGRAGGAADPRASAAERYDSAPRLQSRPPGLHKEAVAIAPRTGPPGRREEKQPGALDITRSAPPPYTVNPITGAIRPAAPPAADPAAPPPPPRRQPQQHSSAARPQTAPPTNRSAGAPVEAAAAVEAAAVGTTRGGDAAVAAADEQSDGERGIAAGAAEAEDQEQRRRMRRLSSPGMFVRTPPHYRISQYYDHVSPTEDVLRFLRRQALLGEQRRRQGGPAAAAAQAAGAARGEAADGGAEQEAATLAAMQEVLSLGAQRGGSAARGDSGTDGAGEGADSAGSPAGSPPHGRVQRDRSFKLAVPRRPASTQAPSGPSAPQSDPWVTPLPADASTTDRIAWIIETAYELDLAEALGLEGPPPYPRSHRLSPSPHRRRFYDAVYDSPERYVPYRESGSRERARRMHAGGASPRPAPYTDAAEGAGGLPGGPDAGAWGHGYASSYGYDAGHRAVGGSAGYGRYGSPPPQRGGEEWGSPDGGETAYRVRVAAARRYVREAGPPPEAKQYGRSRRLRPW